MKIPKKIHFVVGGGQIQEEKQSETSDQRLWRNTRLLKAVGTGLLLGMAGMGGAEARPESSGSALQRKGHDNATDLSPAFNQKGFNNLSHWSALEFDPSTISQADRARLKALGMTDQEIENVQQGRFEDETSLSRPKEARRDLSLKKKEELASSLDSHSRNKAASGEIAPSPIETHQEEQVNKEGKGHATSDEKKIAAARALIEKAKTNPKIRKLLAERWQIQEQESNVTRRELAVPEDSGTSIVFVHGLNGQTSKGSDAGHDCTQYWGDAMNFLSSQGLGNLRTIGFYNQNQNCDLYLYNPSYASRCTGYHEGYKGSDGTNDESLYHLACKLSWALNDNFGQSNSPVILVGHSMGGILIRETLYQMQENAGQSPFPDTIGRVTHAITFNTPHTGLDPISPHFVCGSCTQMTEMYQAGDLMLDLRKFGQNPQTSGGFTDWTVIGSECDGDVGPINAIDMHASHAIVYSRTGTNSCYDHGGAIHDQIPNQDAAQYYCDTSDPVNSPCSKNYNIGGNWKNMASGPHGLLAMYDAITGNLP